MITNDRQRRLTTSQIKRFEGAIAHAEKTGETPDVDPRLHAAMLDGMRSQLADLQSELREYEALRAGEVTERVFESLLQIPQALIEGRIARRLTQKALGDRLELAEQQIQRYERTRYSGVGVERLQQVADALDLKLKETVQYHVPQSPAHAQATDTPPVDIARARQTRTSQPTIHRSTTMASRAKTGKAAASAAGRTLSSATASTAAKKAAASDLAQVGNRKVTGKQAASNAGKTLASKRASKTAKRAAASDLAQAAKKKR